MMTWIKKHLFYVVLVLVAAVILIGYGIWQRAWLYKEIPVIPENAERTEIRPIGFTDVNSDGNTVTIDFDIRVEDYSVSPIVGKYITLSEEGRQAVIDALKNAKMIVTDVPVGRRISSKHSYVITFDFVYYIGDIRYHRHFFSGDTLDFLNSWYSEDSSQKPERRQDIDHNTRIIDADEAVLYNTLLEIAEKYKVSETIR